MILLIHECNKKRRVAHLGDRRFTVSACCLCQNLTGIPWCIHVQVLKQNTLLWAVKCVSANNDFMVHLFRGWVRNGAAWIFLLFNFLKLHMPTFIIAFLLFHPIYNN